MTRAKKVLGGIAALALTMLLAPGIAQAADYSGNCGSAIQRDRQRQHH